MVVYYPYFIIFFIIMSYSMFVTSLHVSQKSGDLDLPESALQFYHPSRFSLYGKIQQPSNYQNINVKRMEEKKPFEFTFRKSRPKQQHNLINKLNIQRNNLNSIYEKLEAFKTYRQNNNYFRNLSKIKDAGNNIRQDTKEVLERKSGLERIVKDDIMDRQQFTRVPVRPPVVFFRPPPPTPTINPSIFIPTVFGKSCK